MPGASDKFLLVEPPGADDDFIINPDAIALLEELPGDVVRITLYGNDHQILSVDYAAWKAALPTTKVMITFP